MPYAEGRGQMITFSTEFVEPDERVREFAYVRALHNDTIRKIAARKGHPDRWRYILSLNKGRHVLPVVRHHGKIAKHQPKLHSAHQRLRQHAAIKVPGTWGYGFEVSVLAGDERPKVTAGYAKYEIVDVPGHVGINRFDGYDPLTMTIPIQFEGYARSHQVTHGHGQHKHAVTVTEGKAIENSIRILERMAGRGTYRGQANGPPAVIQISCTDNHGNVVPLIPTNYQWTRKNPNIGLYRITGIDWSDGVLSDRAGHRIRQQATVTVTQYTPLIVQQRSAAQRAKERHKSHRHHSHKRGGQPLHD